MREIDFKLMSDEQIMKFCIPTNKKLSPSEIQEILNKFKEKITFEIKDHE